MAIGRIPSFTLFPLLPSGQRIVTDSSRSELNGFSQFTIPATQMTPSYTVNGVSNNRPTFTDTSHFLTIGPEPGMFDEEALSGGYFQRALETTNLSQANAQAVTRSQVPATTGTIPQKFLDQMAQYDITDANYQRLIEREQFRIPNIGLGIQVTTDGNGNIQNTQVVNEQIRYQNRIGTNDPRFALFNSAEITTGATFTANPLAGKPFQLSPEALSALAANSANGINNPAATNGTQSITQFILSRLNQVGSALNPQGPGFNPGEFIARNGNNPFVDKILEIQENSQRLPITGFNAQITPEQARNLASGNAKLDVNVGGQFQQNLAELASSEYQKMRPVQNPFQQARAMDGFMPMAPSLPNTQPPAFAGSTGPQAGPDMGNAMGSGDVMDKRGSGGMYFSLDMGGSGMGHGSFGGGLGSFGGSAYPSPQPRKPLNLVA